MKFQFYRVKEAAASHAVTKGEWRWRLKDRNLIVAEAAQGYKTETACRRIAAKIAMLRGLPRVSLRSVKEAALPTRLRDGCYPLPDGASTTTRPPTFGALRYDEVDETRRHSAAKSYGTKV